MATLKQRLHKKNSSGTYDVVHLETSASLVKMSNGTDLETKIASIDTTIAGKAASSHNHSAANITSGALSVARGGTGNTSVDTTPTSGSTKMCTSGGIYTALSGKAASSHTHTKAQITDFPTTMTPAAHTHAASDVTSGTFNAARIPGLAASKITSGTLSVARGGTGVTANPSLLVNLASTSAASVFAASPRPGVTGTLPVARGGTGVTSLDALKTAMNIQSIFKADTLLSTSGSQSWDDGESFTALSDTSISSDMLAKYLALVISGTITVTNAYYDSNEYGVEATLGWKHCKRDDNTSSSQTTTYDKIMICNKSETTHNFSHIALKHRQTKPNSITFSIFNENASGTAHAAGFNTILQYKKYTSPYTYNFLCMNITYNDAATFDFSYDIKILGIYV